MNKNYSIYTKARNKYVLAHTRLKDSSQRA